MGPRSEESSTPWLHCLNSSHILRSKLPPSDHDGSNWINDIIFNTATLPRSLVHSSLQLVLPRHPLALSSSPHSLVRSPPTPFTPAPQANPALVPHPHSYSNIYKEGVEHLTSDGTPAILLANHSNSLTDALLLTASVPYKVRFWSRSERYNELIVSLRTRLGSC